MTPVDVVLSRVNVVDVVKDEHVNYEFSVPELDQSFGPRVWYDIIS